MAVQVEIDQPGGAGSGTPGQSRKDLWEGQVCDLVASGFPGGATFLWALLYAPPGSAATIGSATSSTATFTPDVTHRTFRLSLTVNSGGVGLFVVFLLCSTKNSVGVVVDRAWRTPAFNEQLTDQPFPADVAGYAPDYDNIIQDLLNVLGNNAPPVTVNNGNSPYQLTAANGKTAYCSPPTTGSQSVQVLLDVTPPYVGFRRTIKKLTSSATDNVEVSHATANIEDPGTPGPPTGTNVFLKGDAGFATFEWDGTQWNWVA